MEQKPSTNYTCYIVNTSASEVYFSVFFRIGKVDYFSTIQIGCLQDYKEETFEKIMKAKVVIQPDEVYKLQPEAEHTNETIIIAKYLENLFKERDDVQYLRTLYYGPLSSCKICFAKLKSREMITVCGLQCNISFQPMYFLKRVFDKASNIIYLNLISCGGKATVCKKDMLKFLKSESYEALRLQIPIPSNVNIETMDQIFTYWRNLEKSVIEFIFQKRAFNFVFLFGQPVLTEKST